MRWPRRRRDHNRELSEAEKKIREQTTPGAQVQIDRLDERNRKALHTLGFVTVLLVLASVITGWQIDRAFDRLNDERIDRVSAQSSINAYFCRKIDEVGQGVGTLFATFIPDPPPPPETLTAQQRRALRSLQSYVRDQKRPPRCREVALKLAILTGADPDDVELTRLRIYGDETSSPPMGDLNGSDSSGSQGGGPAEESPSTDLGDGDLGGGAPDDEDSSEPADPGPKAPGGGNGGGGGDGGGNDDPGGGSDPGGGGVANPEPPTEEEVPVTNPPSEEESPAAPSDEEPDYGVVPTPCKTELFGKPILCVRP